MIVPMKKVSLIIPGDAKEETLTTLRKLGIVHIEITEGTGTKIAGLQEQLGLNLGHLGNGNIALLRKASSWMQ